MGCKKENNPKSKNPDLPTMSERTSKRTNKLFPLTMHPLRKYFDICKVILDAPHSDVRSTILTHIDNSVLDHFCNLARVILFNDTSLTKELRNELKQHLNEFKTELRYLAGRKKKDYKKTRKMFVQKGGNMIAIILAALMPLIKELLLEQK